MSRAYALVRDQLTGFDKQSTELVLRMIDAGWLGYISTKGHAIMHAPDGVTTESIARDSKRARSGLNAEAAFQRWLRRSQIAEQQHVPIEDVVADPGYTCMDCLKPFDTARGLASHRRAHTAETQECPICHKQFKYLDSHRLRTHGVGSSVDAVECLMSVLAELDVLRAETNEYRRRYGNLD